MNPKPILCLALVAFNLSSHARLVRSWSDAELMAASDMVVVGQPIVTKDLDETNSLGWPQSESFRPKFRGVETTFKVSEVLKGMPGSDQIILHHYRFETEWGSPDDGPTLVDFIPGDTNEYLLYLKRDGANLYAAAAGQIDPGLSIKPSITNSAADTNSLRVVVIPSKTEVRIKEKFKVALRLENTTTTNQTVRVWSCSWDEEWKTSNTNISWIGWDCTRNVVRNVEIPPGGAYTNEFEMLISQPISKNLLSFRMGFTPIDSEETFWSDEIKLNIIASATSIAPAAKDAYVNAQLAKLFAGAPVSVALRRAFNNWLLVDVSAADAKAGSMPTFSVGLFGFDNEAAARAKVQEELNFFSSPTALTKAGYDEFYSGSGGRLIGRRGAILVDMNSSPPEGFDAVFTTISKNLSASPVLLPDLIHYAYTMHFGDTAPLHAVLANLNAQIPELSVVNLSDSGKYGQNSVTADYINAGGSKLRIIAKSYDTAATAKAGQEFDQRMIQAGGWNKKETIRGVQVFEDTDYGTMYFQIGLHTFNLTTIKGGTGAAQPLLQKVASVMIANLAPPIKPEKEIFNQTF